MRLRLWVGGLGGAAVAAGGIGWLIRLLTREGSAFDPTSLILPLAWLAGTALAVGIMLAWWLDRGIIPPLRRMMESSAPASLLGFREPLPTGKWGELGRLSRNLEALIVRHRQAMRLVDEYRAVDRQLMATREAIERWAEKERWALIVPSAGSLGLVIETLNRGFARHGEVSEQNQEAARQVQTDLIESLGDARESAEQAERGFVEATALLTTVRELQRLGTEFQLAMEGSGPSRSTQVAAQEREEWRFMVASAIEELVGAAAGSIERLGAGLTHVQDIAEQVQVLGNRSTLIALNAVVANARQGRPEGGLQPLASELKQLAREVRSVSERVRELSGEVESEIAAAGERMRGVRERVAARLEQVPLLQVEEARPSEDVVRLVERIREMVQDATRKGERLSSAGERASRAAERLVHRLEEQVRDMEGLVVRLLPIGAAAGHEELGGRPAEPSLEPPTPLRGGMHLLEREAGGDEPQGEGREERP